MKRAVILGGTGVLGLASAVRLVEAGWLVELTGRDETKMPSYLHAAGVRFHSSDRRNEHDLKTVIGDGADLLIDAACYTGADARLLLPHLGSIASTVMLSSKAVYVDASGRHINSEVAPRFEFPISENQPTVAPSAASYNSREGYGANKVAAEQVLLDSCFPVTVVRASKVHGAGAARPREWMFVKRVLDKRHTLVLARGGRGGDHTTAAVNTAALIECVAGNPGSRILNSADPDALTGVEIARAVGKYLGHSWREILLGDGVDPDLGVHPWDFVPPVVLDTRAAESLGYRAVGTYAETIPTEIDWLVESDRNRPNPADEYFAPLLNYHREDAYLSR